LVIDNERRKGEKGRVENAKRGFPKKRFAKRGFAKRARSEAAMPLLHKIGVEC
jgi:hypothetical protein